MSVVVKEGVSCAKGESMCLWWRKNVSVLLWWCDRVYVFNGLREGLCGNK